MNAPEDALERLAESLRGEGSVISSHVVQPSEAPTLGLLAAAGVRAEAAPSDYALLVETIREGYLLHYSRPRVVAPEDDDLALLAGDYLYARGLERLTALGDLEAVRELSDLISLSALIHADSEGEDAGPALWLGSVTAISAGGSERHEAGKSALRSGDPAASELWEGAREAAADGDILDLLRRAAHSVGFALPKEPQAG
jgi:hypothetical protein